MSSKMKIGALTCRICLGTKKKSKLRSVFSNIFKSKERETIADSMFNISGIQINFTSALPSNICLKCLDSLRTAYKVRKHIIESDSTLKKIFTEEVHVKVEPELLIKDDIDLGNDNDGKSNDDSMSDHDNEPEMEFVDFHPPAEPKESPPKKTKPVKEKVLKSKTDLVKAKDQFQCATCGKILTSGGALASHEKSHVRAQNPKEKKIYICDYCGKLFKHKTYIYVHLFSIHVQHHNGYKCEFCNKYFYKRVFYTGHVNTHKNIKNFQCPECPKAFSKKINLNVHMRVHTGEKPYECQYCEKSYAHHSDRKRHVMMAHTGERPYVCKVCGKGYVKKSCLTAHEKTHGNVIFPV